MSDDWGWVDTEAAAYYTGRTQWALYKWRREGRAIRTRKQGARVEWYVPDLPARRADGTLAPAPPKRS